MPVQLLVTLTTLSWCSCFWFFRTGAAAGPSSLDQVSAQACKIDQHFVLLPLLLLFSIFPTCTFVMTINALSGNILGWFSCSECKHCPNEKGRCGSGLEWRDAVNLILILSQKGATCLFSVQLHLLQAQGQRGIKSYSKGQ